MFVSRETIRGARVDSKYLYRPEPTLSDSVLDTLAAYAAVCHRGQWIRAHPEQSPCVGRPSSRDLEKRVVRPHRARNDSLCGLGDCQRRRLCPLLKDLNVSESKCSANFAQKRRPPTADLDQEERLIRPQDREGYAGETRATPKIHDRPRFRKHRRNCERIEKMSLDQLESGAAGDQVHLWAPEVEDVGVLGKLRNGPTGNGDPEGGSSRDEMLLVSGR